MGDGPTPRQIAKGLLNGVPAPRPLCLPIVFELGAKIEGVALDVYRKNPTRISSALRQMRAPSRADGVTCYFDPFLEAEALGASLDRSQGEKTCVLQRPRSSGASELLSALSSAEAVPQRGRVPVAIEVIRRMNATPSRDFLLSAIVAGPLTLAARIAGLAPGGLWRPEEIAEDVHEFAATVVTQMSTAYLEAGADVIFLREAALPEMSPEACDSWAKRLAPTINVIRFYEALPALQLTDAASTLANWDAIGQSLQDAIVCVPLESAAARRHEGKTTTSGAMAGICLPPGLFQPDAASEALGDAQALFKEITPSILTTADDVPLSTDVKGLAQTLTQLVHPA